MSMICHNDVVSDMCFVLQQLLAIVSTNLQRNEFEFQLHLVFVSVHVRSVSFCIVWKVVVDCRTLCGVGVGIGEWQWQWQWQSQRWFL